MTKKQRPFQSLLKPISPEIAAKNLNANVG